MGIKEFSKVYVLSHVRKFKNSECLFEHGCRKLIGIFQSETTAEKILESYKVLEGFKDYPQGFCLEEYSVNEISSPKLDDLQENRKTGRYE